MYFQDTNTSENLRPNGSEEPKGFFQKMAAFDLFSFVPVPVFSPQVKSSKRSRIASQFVLSLILIYFIFLVFNFLHSNTPKTSQERQLIGEDSFTMPNIALTVIPDIKYGISMVDQSYYSVEIIQGTLYQGLNKTVNESELGTDYKCSPKWLPHMNFTSFLCPKQLGNLKGNLFTSSEFNYIKIDFLLCKNGTVPGVVCQDRGKIEEMLNSARLFLFIKQDESFYENHINAFKALFYYPKFDQLQKYEIYLENQIVKTNPDYFYKFKTDHKQALFYNKEKTYVSQLTRGKEHHLLTIWLRLNEEQSHNKLVPDTLMDIIGKWSALSRVLIAIGAIYFLRHNRKKFYRKNPEWQNFGESNERKRTESEYGKPEVAVAMVL